MATPHRGLPVPAGADVPDVPLWLNALATALDFDLFVIETMPRPAAGTLGRVHHDPGTGAWSLDTGAAWVTVATGGPFLPTAGGALTGFLDLAGNELRGAIQVETRQKITTVAAAGANRNLDAGASPLWDVTLDQNVTFTFTGVDGDRLFLLLRQPAAVKTVAWPATVDWPGAVVPSQVASTAVFYMFTRVAGRWSGQAIVASTGKASTIVKNADESVTSSVTLQDDDELTVALAANTDYSFSIWLRIVHGTGGGDGAIKCALTVPAGATLQWSALWDGSSAVGFADPILASGTALAMVLATAGGNGWVRIEGTVRNGANGGNLTLQWAQNASQITATVVKAGSTLNLVKE